MGTRYAQYYFIFASMLIFVLFSTAQSPHSCMRPTSTRISKPTHMPPLRPPACNFNSQAVLSACAWYMPFWIQTPPVPNLCTLVSHHLKLHINTNPYASHATPGPQLQWPGGTEHMCSASVLWRSKPPTRARSLHAGLQPPQPTYQNQPICPLYDPRPATSTARQYKVCVLGICLFGSKPPACARSLHANLSPPQTVY